MKGLLMKDFYMAVKYCRAYLALTVIFAVCSVFGDNMFLILYPILMAGVIPVNLISYDEKSKWNVYAGVFPYTRRELVSVKYIVAVIFLGFGIALIAIAQAVNMVSSGNINWNEYFMTIGILPTLGLFTPCVLLPTVFKYGVEKGRVVYYAVVLVICGGFGALVALREDADVVRLLSGLGIGFVPVLLGFGIIILFVSWKLSICFYQTREL